MTQDRHLCGVANALRAVAIFVACVIALIGCASRPAIDVPAVAPPPPPIASPQLALVLGSGGARGYAHLGVLQAFEEANIPIDLIVGSSAGSIIGVFYADKANSEEVNEIMLNTGFSDFVDLDSFFLPRGFIGGSSLQRFIAMHMDAKTFDELKIPFIATGTDLETGESVELNSGPIPPAINASVALPGLLKPVDLYGHELIDGGVAEPNPVRIAKRYNPQITVAVDLAQDLSETMPRTARGVYSRAIDIIWAQLNERTLEGADVIIRPTRGGNYGTFAIGSQEALYQSGLDAGRASVPAIRALLGRRGNVDRGGEVVSINP